jgi:hypothetical protein
LPSQDSITRATRVGADGEVKDDRSRVVAVCCPGAIDKRFFLSLEQGKLRALKSRLLASAYSTTSLLHW